MLFSYDLFKGFDVLTDFNSCRFRDDFDKRTKFSKRLEGEDWMLEENARRWPSELIDRCSFAMHSIIILFIC